MHVYRRSLCWKHSSSAISAVLAKSFSQGWDEDFRLKVNRYRCASIRWNLSAVNSLIRILQCFDPSVETHRSWKMICSRWVVIRIFHPSVFWAMWQPPWGCYSSPDSHQIPILVTFLVNLKGHFMGVATTLMSNLWDTIIHKVFLQDSGLLRTSIVASFKFDYAFRKLYRKSYSHSPLLQ